MCMFPNTTHSNSICIIIHSFFFSFALTGLPSAPQLWGNSHSSGWGPTNHLEGPKPPSAAVGPAGLRVRCERTGRQPPCHGTALQQHQRAVPKQLGMTPNMLGGSLPAVKQETAPETLCCQAVHGVSASVNFALDVHHNDTKWEERKSVKRCHNSESSWFSEPPGRFLWIPHPPTPLQNANHRVHFKA